MNKNEFAKTPPMGWNSWDVYGASVTEEELLRNADYLAEHLKPYGWEYVICDIQWYEPEARSSHYTKFADLCMDEYGRLLPAVNRFPSAADGKGFGPIADYIHSKGLKFGVHLMRGIPRQAVHANVPIKGTDVRARSIAHPFSICSWNTDMYGVDVTKPGAQEYYNSVFELFAQWGIDFVKVDDICVEYGIPGDEGTLRYGGDEIEMLYQAIARCGRPIVLSLSPGPAMVEQAEHLRKYAHMWRITNDLWDNWGNVYDMFRRCENWSDYVSEGCYPDCDMLPLGHISIRGCEHGLSERRTRLTKNEQRTMLSLWCIFRSPLMVGTELPDLDEWTLSLLTNEEILRVHRDGRGAKQVCRRMDTIIWKSEDPDGSIYLAVFNTAGWEEKIRVDLFAMDLDGTYAVRDLWEHEECGIVQDKMIVTLGTHEGKIYRLTKAGLS